MAGRAWRGLALPAVVARLYDFRLSFVEGESPALARWFPGSELLPGRRFFSQKILPSSKIAQESLKECPMLILQGADFGLTGHASFHGPRAPSMFRSLPETFGRIEVMEACRD